MFIMLVFQAEGLHRTGGRLTRSKVREKEPPKKERGEKLLKLQKLKKSKKVIAVK